MTQRNPPGVPAEPSPPEPSPVTRLLIEWRSGGSNAVDQLVPLVYDELRRLAAVQMSGERPGHTLQPTALVHEAFARLVNVEVSWQDRGHFFSVAARMMRRILVDHARSRGRAKRGGDVVKVSLEQSPLELEAAEAGIEALDDALEALSALDERKVRIVELHYFSGMTHPEIARLLELSASTVDRDLRLARAWLKRALS